MNQQTGKWVLVFAIVVLWVSMRMEILSMSARIASLEFEMAVISKNK